MLTGLVTPLVALSIILAILMPVWALWVAMRISRHLYHISTALFQIRDELRARGADAAVSDLKPIHDGHGKQLFP